MSTEILVNWNKTRSIQQMLSEAYTWMKAVYFSLKLVYRKRTDFLVTTPYESPYSGTSFFISKLYTRPT